MTTFSVKTAVVEYLILKYAKVEGIVPKATIIRETSMYLPNKPQLTYRVLNGHVETLVNKEKLTQLDTGEYEITASGVELLVRRRAWVKRWIELNNNTLGMNTAAILDAAIDKESQIKIDHLQYENSIATLYDDQVDGLVSSTPDDLIELYSQLKALNTEVLHLRDEIKALKARANNSFKNVFRILQEHNHVETVIAAPNPLDSDDILVDSND